MRRKEDGKLFAVKLIEHYYTKYLESEIQIVDQCDHVNIVKFFEIYYYSDRFWVCLFFLLF